MFRSALADTARGAFGFITLTGELGVGKTRLLEHLLEEATDRNLPVVAGRAAEFEQEMPFGVILDAFDGHLKEGLSQFPAPEEAKPVAQPPFFTTIRDLLADMADSSGLVLVLDDMHWADEASVNLLAHLIRYPPNGGVLIAIAYSPAVASPRLAALAQGTSHRHIPVGPLTPDEAAELLGPQVSDERRQELYASSGGNPFYLLAALHAQRGALDVESPAHDQFSGLPPAVRAALNLELSSLPPATQLIAQASAAVADEFEPLLVAAAAATTKQDALEGLDELVARDIVRPTAERFRFRHPLLRSAAYASTDPQWRMEAHARIVAHLTQSGAPAAARARHVERSARAGDRDAIITLVQASRGCAVQAPSTAEHWLQTALRLMPPDRQDLLVSAPAGAEAATLPARSDLMLELAQLQSSRGRLVESRETTRELRRWLPGHDHHRRAWATRLAARIERLLDRPDEAVTLLQQELDHIPDQRSPAAVLLLIDLTGEYTARGDFHAAQTLLDQLGPLTSRGSPDWELGVQLAITASHVLPALATGDVDAAAYLDSAARLLDATPDGELAEWLDAVTWLCWAETLMGRCQVAADHFKRVTAVARDTSQLTFTPMLTAGLARTLGMMGELGNAAILAQEAAQQAKQLGAPTLLGLALTQQSLIATWSGDQRSAASSAQDALNIAAGRHIWWRAAALCAAALASIGQTGADDPVSLFMLAVNEPAPDPILLWACCLAMTHAAADDGRANEAQEWISRAENLPPPRQRIHHAFGLLTRAHTLAARQAPRDTARDAEDAAAIFEAAGLRLYAAQALLHAGIAFRDGGQRDIARDRVRQATIIFTDCGAGALRDQAVREQRRLGVRVPLRRRNATGDRYGLSPREHEIAVLVAQGHTNQQIAERLFVSVRTVETHLSRIFAKLHVASRVGVARALAQGPPDPDRSNSGSAGSASSRSSRNRRILEAGHSQQEPRVTTRSKQASALPDPQQRSFWDSLTPAEQAGLTAIGEVALFPTGDVLMREGQLGDYILVILTGWVKVCVERDGRERIVATRGPGDLLGERAALRMSRRSATVVALDIVHALRLPTEAFAVFLADHPWVLQVLENQIYDRLTQGASSDTEGAVGATPPSDSPSSGMAASDWTGRNCAIVFTDITGSSGSHRDDDRLSIRRVFFGLLREAFDASNVPWVQCHVEDRGDGALIIAPPYLPESSVVDPMLAHLAAGLRRHNRRSSDAVRVQLRLALHAGPIVSDHYGVSGTSLIHAARLLDSPVAKEQLNQTQADLAVIVSQFVYESVIAHGPGLIDPADYKQIEFRVKDSRLTAWLHLLGAQPIPSQE